MSAPESSEANDTVVSSAAVGRRRGSVTKLASSTYLATLLGIISGPIIARVLGAEGRGQYAAVMIYSSTATMVLSLGMFLSVNYATLTLRQDPRVVYGNILRFTGLLVIPSFLLAAAVFPVVSDLGNTTRIGAVAFVSLAPLGVLQLCLNSFLISEGALGSLTVVRMLPLAINFIGVVTFAATGILTVESYLGLTLVGILATLALAVRSVKIRPKSGGRLGPQVRFGLRAYPGSLSGIANSQLDQLLVAPLLGARDLGHYAVAVTLANLPLGIAQALSARSIRDMSRPEGGLDLVRTGHTVRQTMVLSFVVTAGLAAFIPLLVPLLYGSGFTEVVGLSLVLLVGSVALAISTICGPALSLAGRPGAASIAQLIALIVTASGLAISLPLLGVIGAAITTAVAYWVRAALHLWMLRRCGVTDLRPHWQDVREVVKMLVRRIWQIVRNSHRKALRR